MLEILRPWDSHCRKLQAEGNQPKERSRVLSAERLLKALGVQKILSETHNVRHGVSGLMFFPAEYQYYLSPILSCFTFRMGTFTLQFCSGSMSFDFVCGAHS